MARRKDIEERAGKIFVDACAHEDAGRILPAIRLYRQAAKLGDVGAQSNLGNLLDDKVKPARRAEAAYWYKRAIRAGSATAAYNLAIHYRNLGKRRWHLHWLKAAQRLGDPDVGPELKQLLRGSRVPRNKEASS